MPHSFHHVRVHHAHQQKSNAPSPRAQGIDKLIYVAAIGGPLMTVPQLIKIWVGQNANGVSALSWGAFLVLNIFWLTYGILHRDRPIIITSWAYMLVEIFIVVGIFLYQ